MKIKKNIYHILFFDFFFVFIFLILISFGFFLGFDLIKINIMLYLLINFGIVTLGIIIFTIYYLLCNSYFEFSKDEINLVKNKKNRKKIQYKHIYFVEYHRLRNLFLGDSKGGKLVIHYKDNNLEEVLEVSLPFWKLKKIPIEKILIR